MVGRYSRLLRWGLGVAALAFFSSSGLVMAQQPERAAGTYRGLSSLSGAAVQVKPGQARKLKTKGDVTLVETDNTAAIDFKLLGPRDFAVIGKSVGIAHLKIWQKGSASPKVIPVQVVLQHAPATRVAQVSGPALLPPAQETQVSTAESGTPEFCPEKETVGPAKLPEFTAAAPLNKVHESGVASALRTSKTTPSLSISTSSPSQTQIGVPVDQDMVVQNVGNCDASDVTVRAEVSLDCKVVSVDPMPSVEGSTLVWKFKNIASGGSQPIKLRLQPLKTGELSCRTNVSFGSSSSTKIKVTEPKLVVDVTGPEEASPGETVTLVVSVRNSGTAPVNNVRVQQGKGAKNQGLVRVGKLLPGESRVIQTRSVINQTGLLGVDIVARSDNAKLARCSHKVKVRSAKLEVKTDGPEFGVVNRKGEYKLKLINNGTAAATNVNLVLGLPDALEIVDGQGTGKKDQARGGVRWTLGVLEPGQEREVVLQIAAKNEGEHLQRAVAWADHGVVAQSDHWTRIEPSGIVYMEVTDAKNRVEVGGEVVYQIRVVNRSSQVAKTIRVGVGLPADLELLDVECPVSYSLRGDHIIFNPIAGLKPRSEIEITIRAKASQAGSKKLRVELLCPSLDNPLITEEMTEIVR